MPLAVTISLAFIFGAIIGSFLNVVIHRVPLGLSVVHPPSRCPSCGHQLSWYDNIPILSWALLLRGKCRGCKSSISPRYAIVEALTGGLSALLWWRATHALGPDPQVWLTMDLSLTLIPYAMYMFFMCLSVSIFFIDLEHTIIPHGLSFTGIITGLASPWVLEWLMTPAQVAAHWPPVTPGQSAVGALAGAFVVVSIFVLYFVMRGIPGMGGGDVTLMAMMGAWLGWPALFFVFAGASIQGLVVAGIAMATGSGLVRDAHDIFEEDGVEIPQRHKAEGTPEDEEEVDAQSEHEPGPAAVPFGPFIILAALEYFFLGPWMPEQISMASFYFY